MPTQHIPASTAAVRTNDLYTSYLYQIKSHRCSPSARHVSLPGVLSSGLPSILCHMRFQALATACAGVLANTQVLSQPCYVPAPLPGLWQKRDNIYWCRHTRPRPTACQVSHAGPPGPQQVRPSSLGSGDAVRGSLGTWPRSGAPRQPGRPSSRAPRQACSLSRAHCETGATPEQRGARQTSRPGARASQLHVDLGQDALPVRRTAQGGQVGADGLHQRQVQRAGRHA